MTLMPEGGDGIFDDNQADIERYAAGFNHRLRLKDFLQTSTLRQFRSNLVNDKEVGRVFALRR